MRNRPGQTSSDSLARYRLKKLLEMLRSKEGRGTQLISLYIPPGRRISDVMGMLRQEYGTAANIKSDTTRKNVQDAIVKVMQRLKLFKEVPDTGLVILCGAVPQDGPGSERIETYVIIPPEPINIYLYRCDSRFYIEPLEELLKEHDAYGIIVMDADSATYAVLRGRRLEIVKHITSGVPGKHHKGGQSARRFQRLREMKLLNYFARVGKHANEIFLGIPDLKGIIIAGPGPTKYDFAERDYLDYRLRQKIVAIIDTAYSEEYGVREVVNKAPEVLKKIRYVEEKKLVQKFLYHVGHDTGLAVYGERTVRECLKMGAVDVLLLSEDLDLVRVKVRCSSCGHEENKVMRAREVQKFKDGLSMLKCPKCGQTALKLEEVKEVVEDLAEIAEQMGTKVEVISSATEEGRMLKETFGGVAGILRFVPSGRLT
ncbi:peptide chain release factor 1 [Candidatus Bathyarchaeota archaeon]|nr:MAG: peptide chain release factor 1 [Candidatus Bathyarchaeota archaeon]